MVVQLSTNILFFSNTEFNYYNTFLKSLLYFFNNIFNISIDLVMSVKPSEQTQ